MRDDMPSTLTTFPPLAKRERADAVHAAAERESAWSGLCPAALDVGLDLQRRRPRAFEASKRIREERDHGPRRHGSRTREGDRCLIKSLDRTTLLAARKSPYESMTIRLPSRPANACTPGRSGS